MEPGVELYSASTLGEQQLYDDWGAVSDMFPPRESCRNAWEDDLPVGIARTPTEFRYLGSLSDLAARHSHQRRGIGFELIRKTREKLESRSMILLLAAPAAIEYHPRIGFTRHESA